MLGADKSLLEKIIGAVDASCFINENQKEKIFDKNADIFFQKNP
jgi:hypothetical protein